MNTNFANLDKTAMSSTSKLDEVFSSQFFTGSRYRSSNLLHRDGLDAFPINVPINKQFQYNTNNLPNFTAHRVIAPSKVKLTTYCASTHLPRILFFLFFHRFLFLLYRPLYGKDESISEEGIAT